MIYQGNDVYEFLNGIKLSKSQVYEIIEEYLKEKPDEFEELIEDLELYTKDEIIYERDDAYQEGYQEGYNDGYSEAYGEYCDE